MEISWKWLNLCLGLLFFQLCNGLPLNLEDTVADQHTQFLTGLVAVLLTVCSVVLLAGCLCCQRRNGFKEFRDIQVTASTPSNLDHGHVNPIANGEFTIFTPLSPPHYNNNVFLANEQIIIRTPEDYVYGDIDVSSWFNGPEKDFPRVKLKYIRELGKGWFGKVVEGAAQDVNPDQIWSPVVVRILDANATNKERLFFLHDAEIYRHGSHPNILGLIGRCLDTVPLLLLQEHCAQGDLKGYLRANQASAEKLLSTEYPLMWCCQLSSALKHLHENKVVHPDLASRNCQLMANLSLKLGDYGLSGSKYPQDYYTGSLSVPLRWCSPESLLCTPTTIQPKKTTAEANIWALGVTMWEIYECGRQPYECLNDDEVVSQVFGPTKVRLQRPRLQVLYTDYIFRLMQLCWTNAESRPAVSQIDLMLTDLMQVHKNRNSNNSTESVSADDFDRRWESLKPNVIIKTDNWKSEAVSIDIVDDREPTFLKPLSASLNNLHGSLEDLTEEICIRPVESWLEAEGNKYPLTLDRQSSSDSNPPCRSSLNSESKINFRLGPSTVPGLNQKSLDLFNQNDSFTDSISFVQRTSSDSETEDENWRKKVERGAYTEKVRLKSRSVADLMILTHVDYSESESETPLHSLDYKNFRYPTKNNLESLSVTFKSEGNLLNIEDEFQEELKKLQVERRDSLLFVPDNHSQTNSVIEPSVVVLPSNKRLMEALNSPSEIEPANQIYNVFNVTIDKYNSNCPIDVKLNSANLSEIINLKCNDGTNMDDLSFTRQDSENKSDLGYNTLHNSERNSEFGGSVDEENISEFREEFCQKEDCHKQVEEELKISEVENEVDKTVKDTQYIEQKPVVGEDKCVESQENTVKSHIECVEDLTSEYESDELGLQDLKDSDFVDLHPNTEESNVELVSDSDYLKQLSNKLENVVVDNIMDEMINHLQEERDRLMEENKCLENQTPYVASKHDKLLLEACEHLPGIEENNQKQCVSGGQTALDIEEKHHVVEEPLRSPECLDTKLESQADIKSHAEIVEEETVPEELPTDSVSKETDAKFVGNKNDELDYIKQLSSQIENVAVDSNLAANIVDEMIQHLKEEREHREESSVHDKFKRRKPEEVAVASSEHLPGISESEEEDCDDIQDNHTCDNENMLSNDINENRNLEQTCLEKVVPSKDMDIITNVVARFIETEVKEESKHLEGTNVTLNLEGPNENCQPEKIITDSIDSLVEGIDQDNLIVKDEMSVENNRTELKAKRRTEDETNINVGKVVDMTQVQTCLEKVVPSKDIDILTNVVARFIETEVKEESKHLEGTNVTLNLEGPNENCQPEKILTDSIDSLVGDIDQDNLIVKDEMSVENNRTELKAKRKSEDETNINVGKVVDMTQVHSVTMQDVGNIVNNIIDLNSQGPNSNEDTLISNYSASSDKIQRSLEDLKSELQQTFLNPIIIEAEDTVNNVVNVENNRTDDEKLEILSKSTDGIQEVPKLCDIIQNNDNLMDYIIANYDDLDKEKTAHESKNDIPPQVPNDNTGIETNLDSNKQNSSAFDNNLTFHNNQLLGVTDSEVISPSDNLKISETIQRTPAPRADHSPKEDFDLVKQSPNSKPARVAFDLSEQQEEAMPNSLTHSTVFTSTPFGKKQELSLPSHDTFSSLNLFDVKQDEVEEELLKFSSNFAPLEKSPESKDLKYSLETWDNFLGKTLDYQQPENDDLFDSFSSEPQSLLFLDNDADKKVVDGDTFLLEEKEDCEKTAESNENNIVVVEDKENGTFVIEDKNDGTYVIEDEDSVFGNKNAEQELEEVAGTWEIGGGWFLHPQSNNDHLSGDMQMPSTSRTDSYVGFGMDDEIMAAIRNELLQKLPHAQGASTDRVKEEEEEWESGERNEVFLKYNVYNTPLSPIPEESFIEEDEEEVDVFSTGDNTPKKQMEEIDSDWSDPAEPEILPPDTTTPTNDNSIREPAPNRHTPSQDSCCSNDTLFNLEELTCAEKDNSEPKQSESLCESPTDTEGDKTVSHTAEEEGNTHSAEDSALRPEEGSSHTEEGSTFKPEEGSFSAEANDKPIDSANDVNFSATNVIRDQINIFLTNERNLSTPSEQSSNKSLSDETPSTSAEEKLGVPFSQKHVAPLSSPEDNPWRQLPASLLSYDKVTQNSLLPESDVVPENSESQESCVSSGDKEPDLEDSKPNESINQEETEPLYQNVSEELSPEREGSIECTNPVMPDETKPVYENQVPEIKPIYENSEESKAVYENLDQHVDDIYNESDYINIVNMENTKNSEFSKDENEERKEDIPESYSPRHEDLIIKNDVDDDDNDFYGVLTDIRFSGPTDSQMMSTSFSESNDNDEQDWDSGSDTRSTSSGEFIWKEGEHEESLKALRAAPQDVFEDVKPLEGIAEEITSESEASTSSDEDGETPEFVPSAWDKYATPTKSALRSPEKTLERPERQKSKGVWFKKQKYHCVYEYPREPESPVLQSHDLWKPETDYTAFADWEFDAETYLPPPTDDNDIFPSTFTFKPKCKTARNNLYQLTSITDFPQASNTNNSTDDEFFVSSSARPFDISSLSSQFFPGNLNWIENATPDSGVEDTTPGSITDPSEYPNIPSPKLNTAHSLKKLASDAVNQGKVKTGEVLGGMRHTRNKLKLDLPPSPSAFTAAKTFTVEEPLEPIVIREKPTFSTFGKSRFLVQHVETPPIDETFKSKNVSFEALPYKPCLNPVGDKENTSSYKETRESTGYNKENSTSYNKPCLNPVGDKENASSYDKENRGSTGYNKENSTSYNKILYEPLESHGDGDEGLSGKSKIEFVRGEASLLDSADEDSGIESSTLERKLSSVTE